MKQKTISKQNISVNYRLLIGYHKIQKIIKSINHFCDDKILEKRYFINLQNFPSVQITCDYLNLKHLSSMNKHLLSLNNNNVAIVFDRAKIIHNVII